MRREALTRVQASPPSSERNNPPLSASITAYTRRPSDGATRTPTLPQIPSGSPLPVRRFQLSPPSRERKRPLPGPPLFRSHGSRRASQNPAKTTFGFDGSI